VIGVRIDLNADLGEGFGQWKLGDDAALLAVITSANVACGFHAGDPSIMQRVCEQAVASSVRIGAQVGYRDLAGFGRRRMDIPAADLTSDIVYQLGALDAFARAAGDQVRYVKPHGALYNTAAIDPVQAGAVVDAIEMYDARLPVLTLPDSVLAQLATERDIPVVAEAFADRGYRSDGTLVPRSESGAVLHDPIGIANRAVAIAQTGEVTAEDGSTITVAAASLCVHGDTPGAVHIAHAVRTALLDAGIDLAPFA
jgi:5-oxoprolinase (ATP-hydrolysing) subunit A